MTPCRLRPPEHKPQANPSTPAAVNPFPARNALHAIALACQLGPVNTTGVDGVADENRARRGGGRRLRLFLG